MADTRTWDMHSLFHSTLLFYLGLNVIYFGFSIIIITYDRHINRSNKKDYVFEDSGTHTGALMSYNLKKTIKAIPLSSMLLIGSWIKS
jgi:hypothetical protein